MFDLYDVISFDMYSPMIFHMDNRLLLRSFLQSVRFNNSVLLNSGGSVLISLCEGEKEGKRGCMRDEMMSPLIDHLFYRNYTS